MNGCTNDIKKKATLITQISSSHQYKTNGYDYKSLLTGAINYGELEGEKCYGYIKLKKDPKSVDIYKDNILYRES